VLRAAVALLFLLPLLPSASAAGEAVRVDLEALEGDAGGYYQLLGGSAPNPTIEVPAGAHVELRLVNHGARSHNVALGAPVNRSLPCCLASGAEGTLAFDLPPDFTGHVLYVDALEGEAGMHGVLDVTKPHPVARIVAPTNGSTVHATLDVQLQTLNATGGTPTSYRVMLDGVPRANTTEGTVRLPAPETGHHLLTVQLLDANGTIVDEREVVFFFDPTETPTQGTTTPPPATSSTPAPAKSTPGPGVAALLLVALFAFTRSRRS